MQKRKTSILILCPYPFGESPSQRFRFEQYFGQLVEAGFEVDQKPFFDQETWKILYLKGHFLKKTGGLLRGFVSRIKSLFALARYDFVLVHREVLPVGPPIFEWIIAKLFGKKIVYDFDDAIWLPAISVNNKIASSLKWQTKVKSICQWSYVVSCGNKYLCEYARQFNRRVILNPTTIDTVSVHNPELYPNINNDSGKIVIGWTGTHSTVKYLDVVFPVIEKLEKEKPGKFLMLVIGDKAPSFSISSLVFKEWNKRTEIEDLLRIDIGLMPLTDDMWANGKCGLKALQYMALGIPTLASPVGVNRSIIDNGINGYLCDDSKDWEQRIVELVSNHEMCRKMGIEARNKIIESYSVESNSANFLSLFS